MSRTSQFVFIEDRDPETGHGWRDSPHVVRVEDPPDGPLIVRMLTEDGEPDGYQSCLGECSYAWITTRESWAATNLAAADELRRGDVEAFHPGFEGSDDMEGHFEFNMTPRDMRSYLESLGMEQVGRGEE